MGVLGPLTPLILRSPLHPLLSGRLLLLHTPDGNGERTTVVSYAQRGDHLYLLGGFDDLPPQSLRGGSPVTVRLRGGSWSGRASIVTGLDDIRRAQAVFDGSALEAKSRAPGVVLAEVVLD